MQPKPVQSPENAEGRIVNQPCRKAGAKNEKMKVRLFPGAAPDGWTRLGAFTPKKTNGPLAITFCGYSHVNGRLAATASKDAVDGYCARLGVKASLPTVTMNREGFINSNGRFIEGGKYEAYYEYL